MSSSTFNLPPTPPELKAVSPYVQRAEELKNQDRIISYWCAYYAAQVGISLKARDPASRDFLFALLGELERLKAQIGPNDAIDIESASSAYVENFALKVFANADNEDRSGHATRSTAKKFLAAANFLEVLKIFPKSDISDSTEEKIRYAKWKAADIAKAFREGRKPSPGPPGWAEEQELKRLQQEELEQQSASQPTSRRNVPSNISLTSPANVTGSFSSSPPRSSHHSSSPTKRSPSSSSPPRFDRHTEASKSQGWSDSMDLSSDKWSTAATPGTEFPTATPSSAYTIGTSTPSTAGRDWPRSSPPQSGVLSDRINQDASVRIRSGSGSSTSSNTRSRKVSTPTKSSFKSVSPESDPDKRVHFSPSTSGSPPPSPSKQLHVTPPREYTGPSSIYAPPQVPVPPPTVVYSTQPPVPTPTAPVSTPSPPRSYIYGPPATISTSSPRTARYTAPSPPAPVEVDLTPALIAKIQKHCRFAISALDYEDGEQARKELRTALALLGE